MAQKKLWISWLSQDPQRQPQAIVQALGQAGLDPSGAAWQDDLDKMAWAQLASVLLDPAACDGWLIAGDQASLEKFSNRYGMSLLAAMCSEERGADFPLFVLADGFEAQHDSLPLLLRNATALSTGDPAWAAKVVARFFSPRTIPLPGYRLNVIAHPMFGQWFEVGPRQGQWQGAIFGVAEGSRITHHGVGPKGRLPERCTLEYPVQDMKVEVAGAPMAAWAVQNALGSGESYYVNVRGAPGQIMFGANPVSEESEVSVVLLN